MVVRTVYRSILKFATESVIDVVASCFYACDTAIDDLKTRIQALKYTTRIITKSTGVLTAKALL